MLASTLLRWEPIGPGLYRVRCPWCGTSVEFRPQFREWYCGRDGCGHNATVAREWCTCPECMGVEEDDEE